MSDATHFVADEFVRTRNMLEAIAVGKPVVTHLWLESCGQASCLIDEKSYMLRDARKEKEFGFSMPISLARACQHPILQVKMQPLVAIRCSCNAPFLIVFVFRDIKFLSLRIQSPVKKYWQVW